MPGNPWKNLIVLMSKPTFSGLHGIVESFDTTHGILSKSVHELLYGELRTSTGKANKVFGKCFVHVFHHGSPSGQG
jgi:hypothetical protein